MKAMILAAGLGTRLKPLTDTRPKALVEIAGRTLLEITLTRLRTFGVSEVIINVHHFADQVTDYLKSHKNFGMRVEISREDALLDTGGGLKKAAWFFLEDSARHDSSRASFSLGDSNYMDKPFLLHNVDVISTIDITRMLQFHKDNHALATLAVQSRETSRYLLFNNDLQLCGRRMEAHSPLATRHSPLPQSAEPSSLQPLVSQLPETAMNCHSERSEESAFSVSQPAASQVLHPLAFSGIHIISPRLLPMLTEQGVFSIIPAYLRLAAQSEKILAFRADNYCWRDLGRPSDLAQAALDLQ